MMSPNRYSSDRRRSLPIQVLDLSPDTSEPRVGIRDRMLCSLCIVDFHRTTSGARPAVPGQDGVDSPSVRCRYRWRRESLSDALLLSTIYSSMGSPRVSGRLCLSYSHVALDAPRE